MKFVECENCIFPRLKGCPVGYRIHNAACLQLSKDYNTDCKSDDCNTCRYRKYCKESEIIKNNDLR